MIPSKIRTEEMGNLPASKLRISDLFITLSRALDMINTNILFHSRKVAYISLELGKEMGLKKELLNKVVLAALIHDIGIRENENKIEFQKNYLLEDKKVKDHCQRGYKLAGRLSFVPDMKDIILHHHHKWSGPNFNGVQGEDIPLPGRIIYLADRVDALLDRDQFILTQSPQIIKKIKKYAGELFDPEVVKNFVSLAKKEYFWLNINSRGFNNIIKEWGDETQTGISLSNLEEIASLTADIIDRKSPFTSRHSTGVATIASMITHDMGYDLAEQRAMRIAGLFHDLGKLMIPSKIIEKKDRLTEDEYNIVKQHPYYTYKLLNEIKGLGSIPHWAGFHHEKLDGSGYPFHLNEKYLDTGSKIMAVSDIFQALTEERPYRPSFSMGEAVGMLEDMSKKGKLDYVIVKNLAEGI
ncbi:MAG: HD-GYP domain-containing protein [Halanaerobiales bacterium]